MNIRKNIFLALASGALLGQPWSLPSLFWVIFFAWVPMLLLEEHLRRHPNPYVVFNYALVSFLLWNIIATWWLVKPQPVGAIFIIVANAMVQALVFWLACRIRSLLGIPLLIPFALTWMGYEYFHLNWDLAWPWLNLGNALATAPQLIQWYEFTGVRGGSLWIILVNFAFFKIYRAYREKRQRPAVPLGVIPILLLFTPMLGSYLIFKNFEIKSRTLTNKID